VLDECCRANPALSPEVVGELPAETGWYTLYAPDGVMPLGRLDRLTLWHDMAIALLRKYYEMFYNLRRKQWEADKLQSGDVNGWNGQTADGLEFIWCERHFYQPLLTDVKKISFPVSPGHLTKGRQPSSRMCSRLCSQWREHEGQRVTQERMESWNILFPEADGKHLHKLVAQVQ
jgi:hypothetical protein